MNFEAKKVLVTGGSRGIGLAISKAFASAGARVAIIYRANDAAAAAALAQLPGAGHSIHRADIADPEQVRLAVDAAATQRGLVGEAETPGDFHAGQVLGCADDVDTVDAVHFEGDADRRHGGLGGDSATAVTGLNKIAGLE